MKRTNKGFTLVEIMIVVAIIALLAAVAIPNLLRAKISANDALARSTLRALSTSSETFATAQNGNYPLEMSSLSDANPPYMSGEYCDEIISGFSYECDWGVDGYTFTATPVTIGASGTTVFTMSTGGVLE